MADNDLERIRMLEDRMRKPSKPALPRFLQPPPAQADPSQQDRTPADAACSAHCPPHEEGELDRLSAPDEEAPNHSEAELPRSNRSVDSRKISEPEQCIAKASIRTPLPRDQSNESRGDPSLDFPPPRESLLRDSKITDFYSSHPSEVRLLEAKDKLPEGVPLDEPLREENRLLKLQLGQKDEGLQELRESVIRMAIELQKARRSELKMKVHLNKLRLGEYTVDKKGKDYWVDGAEVRELKLRIEDISARREELERLKKTARRAKDGKEAEEVEDWKGGVVAQACFLAREESHLQEQLRRLEEEKAVHMKECRTIQEEEQSKFGRADMRARGEWRRINQFQLLGLLGKGGFSEVYKAIDVDSLKEVALKVHEFHPGWEKAARDSYTRHAIRENKVHGGLDHPNIVKLFDTVELDASSFCTVLEYCDGPDLASYLRRHKRLPEKEARVIARQVASALKYLHELEEKVIHYDLKPQNILFHRGRVKITDFGLCKITREEVMELTSQGVGTYWYLPPECFETDRKAVITPKVDIWSLGVIYYEMLFGEKPFGNQMSQLRILHEGVILKANNVTFPLTQKGLVSQESKNFIKECLQFHVDLRMDSKAAFEHPLFQRR